jgi:hypothetical protein
MPEPNGTRTNRFSPAAQRAGVEVRQARADQGRLTSRLSSTGFGPRASPAARELPRRLMSAASSHHGAVVGMPCR